MKKSLIAITVMAAFATTASAQSSVTLYGLVDLSVINTKGGSRVGGNSVTELLDGVAYGPGSRWGLRVSEDLGSGLKANVVLESGFGADTGAQTQGTSNLGIASRLFGRQAFVSLASASLGELRLGRQYALHDEVNAVNNPFGSTTVLTPTYPVSTGGTNPAARSVKLPFFVDGPRVDNAVQYISPTFAGFRAQAMVAASEGQANTITTPNSVVPRYEAVKLSYFKGPINVAVSYDQNRNGSIPGTHDKVLNIAANYDFGMAKVFAGYQLSKELTPIGMAYSGVPSFNNIVPANSTTGAFPLDELKGYIVGVAVPIGSTTLGAVYTRVKYSNVGDTLSADLGKFAVGATYGLSKQTTLYAAASVANGDLKDSIQEKRAIQVGLRKAF
ncbi:porin [Azohydromonas australica]|uniref:porin n=1 Tax=Azohydromonas australica TaxID=364039 RepID=UPI00040AE5B6|nr:porin [Azohydromonas australica]